MCYVTTPKPLGGYRDTPLYPLGVKGRPPPGTPELTKSAASDGTWFPFCLLTACVGYFVLAGITVFSVSDTWPAVLGLAAIFVVAGLALRRGRPGFVSGWICGTLLGLALLLGGLFWLAVTIGS